MNDAERYFEAWWNDPEGTDKAVGTLNENQKRAARIGFVAGWSARAQIGVVPAYRMQDASESREWSKLACVGSLFALVVSVGCSWVCWYMVMFPRS